MSINTLRQNLEKGAASLAGRRSLKVLSELAAARQIQAYLVGGTVREVALGREAVDLDLGISAEAVEVARDLARVLKGTFVLLDESEGTARVVAGAEILDLAEFRAPGLEGDLKGRDFTINALALDLNGILGLSPLTVIDPLGLGADAANERAVRRIFEVKGRPADHPVIVHLAGVEELPPRWAREVPPAALRLAERFWPGPLTLILNRAPGVHDVVTGGQDPVGLRVPAHPVAHALLELFGGGIAGPSANQLRPYQPDHAHHVRDELGDRVDLVLDGGSCTVGIESTIVDLSSGNAVVLRPGQIGASDVEAALGVPVSLPAAGSPRASGTLAAHYAPKRPLSAPSLPRNGAHSQTAMLVTGCQSSRSNVNSPAMYMKGRM